MQDVEISLLGVSFRTKAHVLADSEAHSVNVHFPVTVNLDGLDGADQLDFTKIMTIDPEKFGRNQGLYTQSEAQKIDAIPAPADYFKRLNP